MIRDLCPAHGEPMWHWPAGSDDAYACQRPDCGATTPVTQRESMAYSMHWLYASSIVTPPQSPFRLIATA